MSNTFVNGTSSVSTTAGILSSSDTSAGVIVKNQGPRTVYLGSSTVTADQTSTGGLPVAVGETLTVPATGSFTSDLYAVTASGTATVSWLHVNS
jgi:hypothetical protein